MHYTCIACITIDSVMRMGKKSYQEYKHRIKKRKMTKFIEAELESESESELESDIKLELKPELNLTLNNCLNKRFERAIF